MPKKKFDYGEEAGERGEYHTATSDTGRFWGSQGAGCMPLAESTGRVLLTLRSQYVNEPGTWGIPGGAIDEGENPAGAAQRELREELGYSGPVRVMPGFVFEAEDFRYHNFIGVVPEEFEASLDWENGDAKWFDIDRLPSPLHFGVRAFLSNSGDLIRREIDSVRNRQEAMLRTVIRSLID